MQHVSPSEFAPSAQISDLTAEEYFALLHPEGCRGRPAVFIKTEGQPVENYSLDRENLLMQMPSFVDRTSYLTLNRFWSGRLGKSLAAFNALYADLDYYNTLRWRGKSADEVQAAYCAHLQVSGVPQPSICLHSGRGLAAIWLIDQLPATVRLRWQAAMKALIQVSASFGVDASAKDSSRVLRIPETINEKSRKAVRVSGGNGLRYSFDELADQVFLAAGRPTRAQLEERRKSRPEARRTSSTMPRGLTQAQRFKLIQEDLEAVRIAHGGLIQEGFRNTWLHLWATCLTHRRDRLDIETEVTQMAAIATPGLEAGEVAAAARQAVEKAKQPAAVGAPGNDGRYYYAGASIAEKLDIPPEMARELDLKQVVPEEERKRRKAAKEKQRRAERGATTREGYLGKNNATRTKPWRTLGIGRTKYYSLKKAGLLDEGDHAWSRTGPCPPQGRSYLEGPEGE